MPLKYLLYRWVLRFSKNTVLDAEFRRWGGRTFQAAGPATVNAPSANFVLVLTTEKFPRWVERSRSLLQTYRLYTFALSRLSCLFTGVMFCTADVNCKCVSMWPICCRRHNQRSDHNLVNQQPFLHCNVITSFIVLLSFCVYDNWTMALYKFILTYLVAELFTDGFSLHYLIVS